MKNIFIFKILLLARLTLASACDSESKINKYFSKNDNPKYDLFKNFNSFTELKLECSQKYNTTGFVVFNSNHPIIIDQTLNFNEILADQSTTAITMIYFKGIDIIARPYEYLIHQFYLLFSKLAFYNNNTLISKNNCIDETFKNVKYSLFSNFYSIFFYASYDLPLCPYAFQNTNLDYLFFTDISNSLINKNILSVLDVNGSLNNNINKLILDTAYYELNSDLMNKNLFSSITTLRVYGYLNNIQADLFASFTNIKNIDLQLDNFKSFFQKGNEWMTSLNKNFKVNLSNYNEVYKNYVYSITIRFLYKLNKSVISKMYTYPDEDFCLFRNFPHDHLVVPIILPGKRIECSCTLLWLIQYYSFYFFTDSEQEYDANLNYLYANYDTDLEDKFHKINYCHNEHFEESISRCNFKQRLKLCNKKIFIDQTQRLIFDNDTDLFYLIKWLQLIIIIVIQPFLSIMGIINSLITIYIINKKETKKHFTDKMYKHIVINCVFNIFFCCIMLLGLVNQCLFYNSAVFCSKINQYESTQYFTIIVIYYLGNSVKLCKNISFLSFTFSRYILSINKKKGVYDKFNKMNLKVYVLIIILISSLLSMYKFFEYSVIPSFNLLLSTPFDKYSETECNINFTQYCYLFLAMKLINYFFNDFLLYLINFVIDIKLVIDYNAYLIKKQKLLSSSISSAQHHLDNIHTSHNEEAKTKENKVTRMVVISNTLYLLTSLPEFLSSLFLNIFSGQLSQFSAYNFSTSLITNESGVFCLFSIVLNFFILLFFNQNFKKSFLSLLKKNNKLNSKDVQIQNKK